jgi:pimeloyl-ACP methyl ester carboxylesterase
VDSVPGPGIEGHFDGPYYSYYQFPRSFDDDDQSMLEAYALLYDIIEDQGPFDGVLGFSHGGTLASGFLIHHAKTRPQEPAPFRCAVFLNSLPPFRMNPGEEPIVDQGLSGHIQVPTLSVVGSADFAYKHSIHLHKLCAADSSTLIVHGKGHDVPRDE